jgi:hypothetical protein
LKTCTGWLCIASAHIMSAQRTSQKPLAAQNPLAAVSKRGIESHSGMVSPQRIVHTSASGPACAVACTAAARAALAVSVSAPPRRHLPRSRTCAVERRSVPAESESATGESGWRGQPVPAQMWRTCDDRVKDALLEGDHHIEVLHARRPPASRPARGELNSARQRRSGSADGARPAASAVAAVLRRRRVRTSAFG